MLGVQLGEPGVALLDLGQCFAGQVGRRTRDFTLSPQPATAQNLEAAYRASVYVPSGAPLSVENFAKKNPHRLGAWDPATKAHVATMTEGDFYGNE